MKLIGVFITLLAFLAFVLPSLPAQDGKKDADKTEKKDEPAKDDKKDPEKKDSESKDDKKDSEKKKVEKKTPEKLVYGTKFVTKILGLAGESNRAFNVEVHVRDPKKVFEFNSWYNQRSFELTRQQNQALAQTDANARFQQLAAYQRDVAAFQIDTAKRGSNLTTPQSVEVRAAENAKVRTLFPPVEFDDLGFPKKWTKKELDERRDKTGLPGYAVDFESLKAGQYVEIYMAKVAAPMKKTPTKKKANPADDDDTPAAKAGQEFVLIVIRQEAGK